MLNDLFIFEMANNHQGSVSHGLAIIEAMAEIAHRYHIRAGVKFQFRDLDTLIHPAYRDAKNIPHIPRFMATKLKPADYTRMIERVRQLGMIPIATPFDEPSVKACIDLGIEIIKVASCSAQDWPLLAEIVKAGKPVIASTGGLDLGEVDRVESYLRHAGVDFALLHCIATYPAVDVNLGFMRRMKLRYPGRVIGYSGHEAPDNVDVVKCAVAMGAQILERHVGLPNEHIRLNSYSMTPAQTDVWVSAALTARRLSEYGPRDEAEAESILTLQRGVYAGDDIKAGDQISFVFYAMPCQPGQLTSGEFASYRAAYTASRDYAAGDPIIEPRQPDSIDAMRSIIHEVRGMLSEAGIVIGNSPVELSHHYGIEKFRKVGATIVNVINLDYCKKLVVLLPGQFHPAHYHKRKQETFVLLSGDLTIVTNGITATMQPGDQITIRPGDWHEFTSAAGAIVEEVSTHHYTGDSVYRDEKIARLDPVQRKTLVEF